MTLRGKVSDLYIFVKDGLIHEEVKEIHRSDGSFEFAMPLREMVWIAEQRGFCFFCENLAVTAETDDSIIDMELFYSKAWDIDAHELLALSKRFELDVNVSSCEHGNCFKHHIQIQNGEVVQDETTEWDWYAEMEQTDAEALDAE